MSRLPARLAELGTILLNHSAEPWQQVRRLVEAAANSPANILLLGAPGTGKDAVARAIHSFSSRRNGPFVTLLHGKPLPRLLSNAKSGTLFVDTAGGSALELQQLLTLALSADVRLIVTAEAPLSTLLRDPRFGAERLHQLRMFPITLPELCDCPEVLPALVRELLFIHSRKAHKQVDKIPPKTMQAITSSRWPGNLPELDEYVLRAVARSRGRTLEAPLETPAVIPAAEPARNTLEAVERGHIVRTLHECLGVITTAAAQLGLPRTTLNARIKKLGIQRGEY